LEPIYLTGFQAWDKCTVQTSNGTEWSLSANCLTGRKAQSALNEYLKKDQDLHNEIASRMGSVQGIESGEAENEMDLDQHDDADVPLSAVIREELGLTLPECHGDIHVVTKAKVMSDGSGHLTADTSEEDIWAYGDTGDKWGVNGVLPVDETDSDRDDDD
jgi:hypothetical protein